jgi:hypothetical protein
MIQANRRLKIREISNALNIPFSSLHHILIKKIENETGECGICSESFVTRTERTPPVDIIGVA